MYQQKKPRDYRSLWLISVLVLVIGIVLTIRLSLIRPLGYSLLAVGGIGIVWSLANMDNGRDHKDREDHRNFN
ncbi:MAG: hypothetical protein V2B15_14705 [Bacteroidota bacterium]